LLAPCTVDKKQQEQAYEDYGAETRTVCRNVGFEKHGIQWHLCKIFWWYQSLRKSHSIIVLNVASINRQGTAVSSKQDATRTCVHSSVTAESKLLHSRFERACQWRQADAVREVVDVNDDLYDVGIRSVCEVAAPDFCVGAGENVRQARHPVRIEGERHVDVMGRSWFGFALQAFLLQGSRWGTAIGMEPKESVGSLWIGYLSALPASVLESFKGVENVVKESAWFCEFTSWFEINAVKNDKNVFFEQNHRTLNAFQAEFEAEIREKRCC